MTRYNAEIRTGDIPLYEWRGIVGRIITTFTGGNKSHAGIIVVDGGRHYVLDATMPYVDVRPISVDVARGARIRVVRANGWVTWNGPALADFAYAIEGRARYDTWDLVRNAWVEVFGGVAGLPDPEAVPKRFMCSELVSCCCRLFARFPGGLTFDPVPLYPDRYTSPRDLDRSPMLETVTDQLAFL